MKTIHTLFVRYRKTICWRTLLSEYITKEETLKINESNIHPKKLGTKFSKKKIKIKGSKVSKNVQIIKNKVQINKKENKNTKERINKVK